MVLWLLGDGWTWTELKDVRSSLSRFIIVVPREHGNRIDTT